MKKMSLLVLGCALAEAALAGFWKSPVCAPDAVTVEMEGATNLLARAGNSWSDGRATVSFADAGADASRVSLTVKDVRPRFVRLAWNNVFPVDARVLRDCWERADGDIGWFPLATVRESPWYFMVTSGGQTHGWGVQVQPGALACWTVKPTGFELLLDVRAGGRGVDLGSRTLEMVTLVGREGRSGESAFAAARAFCAKMCPRPRLPTSPVYGYNDWYCAYGRNTATNFLADAANVVSLAEGLTARPYVVMDDGWQKNSPPVVAPLKQGASGWGPWDASGAGFGMEMSLFAKKVTALGAQPGLWYRPFRAWAEMPSACKDLKDARYVDPTVPEVRATIVRDMTRFRAWGFKLVKIDYLTYDLCRVWGRGFTDRVFRDDCVWRDETRTSAEVMRDLYGAMRAAAGESVAIIGCNALNHFAAGLFEMQRVGNDTSGWKWAQTRQMGVNCLAMRAVQDRAFFAADADCAGLAKEGAVPWEKNRQWIDLLGRSGTPIFISWHRSLMTPEVRAALSAAFRAAAAGPATAEPLDWMETRFPRQWRFGSGEVVTYDWD